MAGYAFVRLERWLAALQALLFFGGMVYIADLLGDIFDRLGWPFDMAAGAVRNAVLGWGNNEAGFLVAAAYPFYELCRETASNLHGLMQANNEWALACNARLIALEDVVEALTPTTRHGPALATERWVNARLAVVERYLHKLIHSNYERELRIEREVKTLKTTAAAGGGKSLLHLIDGAVRTAVKGLEEDDKEIHALLKVLEDLAIAGFLTAAITEPEPTAAVTAAGGEAVWKGAETLWESLGLPM